MPGSVTTPETADDGGGYATAARVKTRIDATVNALQEERAMVADLLPR